MTYTLRLETHQQKECHSCRSPPQRVGGLTPHQASQLGDLQQEDELPEYLTLTSKQGDPRLHKQRPHSSRAHTGASHTPGPSAEAIV